ncbi:MAG TPA: AAA family ATPase, partial [Acidimicrobiia bacterium]|nr:AAA family ATPase [Acidimicrobiia bacterium]
MGAVAPTGTTRWPLVGRQVELDRCVDALDDGVALGVFVHGAAGVGKTRLADEVVARLSSAGRLVLRSRGSVASASIPLGALVHLLPAELLDDRFDPLTLYSGVARALGGDEQRSVVVFVDDAQWLDPTSAALLGQLLDGGVISVVGTVRTGEPASSAVSGLWCRDDVLRIDLDVLSFDDVDTLLHLALGGPVDKTALGQIWAASGGNALFVKELVLGALSRDHLVERRMVWWLTGPLASTPRLAELVGQRVREVGGGERSVLEVVAVWESVGLHELTALHGPEPVEGLERAGLLEVHIDGRRETVVLAHPLHGEVVRADLPTMTRRRLLLERAERIEGFGARRREDLPQVATARLEGSGRADPDLLVRAA